jgi:hypothetical protein
MFRASSERPTQFLEVNSGTERPSAASDDDDAHIVRGRWLERLANGGGEGSVHGVERLGPVEMNHSDVPTRS